MCKHETAVEQRLEGKRKRDYILQQIPGSIETLWKKKHDKTTDEFKREHATYDKATVIV